MNESFNDFYLLQEPKKDYIIRLNRKTQILIRIVIYTSGDVMM